MDGREAEGDLFLLQILSALLWKLFLKNASQHKNNLIDMIKQKGLYQNKVTLSLASIHNCKMAYWKPSSGRSQETECYKRLVFKQFVQVSGLCGQQFLSYLPKRFTHLCRASYGDAILVYRNLLHQYGYRKSTKTSGVHFFYKISFFPLENQHTCA